MADEPNDSGEQPVDHYKEFRELGKRENTLGELVAQADVKTVPNIASNSIGELREGAYNYGKDSGKINPEEFPDKNALSEEAVEQLARGERLEALNDLNHYFRTNVEDIVAKVPEKGLAKLLGTEIVMQAAKDDQREVMSAYLNLKATEELKTRYETKKIAQEDLKAISQYEQIGLEEERQSRIKAAEEKEKERQKARGYTNSALVKNAGALTGLTFKEALETNEAKSKEMRERYVLKGIDAAIAESKKAYDEVVATKGDVQKAAKATFKQIAESKNEELINKARELVYRVGE
jgi:hypothetical protein